MTEPKMRIGLYVMVAIILFLALGLVGGVKSVEDKVDNLLTQQPCQK